MMLKQFINKNITLVSMIIFILMFILFIVTKPEIVFDGPAREAASYYPKNSNILAMLALFLKTAVWQILPPAESLSRK